MKLQQLYSYTRRAIDTWQMIDEGDKIAINAFIQSILNLKL